MARAQALLMGLVLLIASRACGQCSQWIDGPFGGVVAGADVNDMRTFDLDGGGPEPARLIAATDRGVWVWDLVNWRPLGEGLAEVSALIVFNGSLVAGAYYDTPHLGVVVRWNGNGWVQMGAPLGRVSAFAVYQGALVAAGWFDGVVVHDVARWDGSTWSGLGIFAGGIHAMTVFDLDGSGPDAPRLIIGGYVETSAPPPSGAYYVPFISMWDGSVWEHPPSWDVPCGARDFIEFEGGLYVCGVKRPQQVFGDGIARAVLAKWNVGTADWSEQVGIEQGRLDPVCFMTSMTQWNGDLVVVGLFDYPGSDNVLLFDGTQTSPLVGGQPGNGLRVACMFGPNVAVAGNFIDVAQCNGLFWVPVNSSGFGNAFATLGSRLVVGGNLTTEVVEAGVQRQAYNLVGWNGSILSHIAGGTNGPVHALEGFVSGPDQLIVGGSFSRVGEGISAVNVNNIALRTEPLLIAGTWSPMGNGFNGPVLAVERVPANQFFDEFIVAAGQFTAAGTGSPAFGRVAQWSGSPPAWSAMGAGFNSTVRALKSYSSGATGRFVIAGGDFTIAGSVQANRIAMWATPAIAPGPAWAAMGSGFNGPVHAIERFNFATYAAGAFTASGATTLNRIARWDTSLNPDAWVPVGNGIGFNGTVRALLTHGSFLYAAGDFTSVDGVPCDRIARWDGSVWADAGSGSDAPGLALATFRGELHAGIASDDTSVRYLTDTPWLTQQPSSQTVPCSQSVTFEVAAAQGYSGLSFTWRKGGTPLAAGPTGHGSSIQFIANRMTITNVRGLDAGAYDCVLSSAECGSVTSSAATLTVPGWCPPCPADTNGDALVNVTDLLGVISAWGVCTPPPVCAADIDQSGVVNVTDLLAVISAWGSCP